MPEYAGSHHERIDGWQLQEKRAPRSGSVRGVRQAEGLSEVCGAVSRCGADRGGGDSDAYGDRLITPVPASLSRQG